MLAYVGSIQNLKDLKDLRNRGFGAQIRKFEVYFRLVSRRADLEVVGVRARSSLQPSHAR